MSEWMWVQPGVRGCIQLGLALQGRHSSGKRVVQGSTGGAAGRRPGRSSAAPAECPGVSEPVSTRQSVGSAAQTNREGSMQPHSLEPASEFASGLAGRLDGPAARRGGKQVDSPAPRSELAASVRKAASGPAEAAVGETVNACPNGFRRGMSGQRRNYLRNQARVRHARHPFYWRANGGFTHSVVVRSFKPSYSRSFLQSEEAEQ